MLVHQVYSMVDENGIVQNITVGDNYEDANRIARAVYGSRNFVLNVYYWKSSPFYICSRFSGFYFFLINILTYCSSSSFS